MNVGREVNMIGCVKTKKTWLDGAIALNVVSAEVAAVIEERKSRRII